MKTWMRVALLVSVPTMAVAQRPDVAAAADDSLLEAAVARMSGSLTVASETPGGLVVLDVVKDAFHQINHCTGKDVSDESIADAAIPLDVHWRSDSHIRVPLSVEPVE